MEVEGLVVSEAVKFPVKRRVAKASREEWQTHGFEVDLVGARHDMLVLASVKSFFGSRGVVAEHVAHNPGYAMLNDPVVRDAILEEAKSRYKYPAKQIEFRLYVGRFAARKSGENERLVREWCAQQRIGSGPVAVYGVVEVAEVARRLAERKTYRNNPALVAIKVLQEAGMLTPLELTSGVTPGPGPQAEHV